jgi:hypothetical protein
MIRSIARHIRLTVNDNRERKKQAWLNARRIAALAPWIPKSGAGAELGVHKGYFSRVLFDALSPKVLYLIDPWYRQEGEAWTWGEGNRSTIDGLCNTLHVMAPELVSLRAVLVIQPDLRALRPMPDASLDWAYIDTTHQYQQTAAELALLKRKVKRGGVIAGDDWREDPNHRHHGVCRAVNEFVSREKYRFLLIDKESAQWAITTEEK